MQRISMTSSIVSTVDAEGRWELHRRAPHPLLRSSVLSYVGYREDTPMPVLRRELPQAQVVMVLNLGAPFAVGRVSDQLVPVDSFVAGIDLSHSFARSAGPACCIQVNFSPPGARQFFGVPMHALAGQMIPLDALLGARASRLLDRLAALPMWSDRFELLDRLIGRRVLPNALAPEVEWAWRQLMMLDGQGAIMNLTDELGWSPRRLIEHFRDQIGLTPKASARLLRFEQLVKLIQHEHDPVWSRLAGDIGFSDQAHLIREFRRFAGISPAAYVNSHRQDGEMVTS
mgnify:CR=1 FL=1